MFFFYFVIKYLGIYKSFFSIYHVYRNRIFNHFMSACYKFIDLKKKKKYVLYDTCVWDHDKVIRTYHDDIMS